MFTHLSRSIILTGTLSPPIVVNSSDFLKTTKYSVQMNEDININHLYIQGGPGKSVAEFQKKVISGNIGFNLRLSEANLLEKAVIDLINAGQNYNSLVTLTTLLLPYNAGITAETPPYITSTNSLVFDTCLVESLTIVAKKDANIEIDLQIKGQTDFANTAPITVPSDDSNIYRKLNWYDCFFARNGSQIENATEVEIRITKEIDQRYFLMTYGTTDRYDRPYSTGVKSIEVSFKIVEHITSLFDIFTYSFGGFYDSINFSGNFGPLSFNIPNAILKISTQSLPADIIERTTEGFYRLTPITPETENFFFSL
jgi:hypothetical protein